MRFSVSGNSAHALRASWINFSNTGCRLVLAINLSPVFVRKAFQLYRAKKYNSSLFYLSGSHQGLLTPRIRYTIARQGERQMAKQGFKILDSDMHVMEPPDLWERYIESKYRYQERSGLTSFAVSERRSV